MKWPVLLGLFAGLMILSHLEWAGMRRAPAHTRAGNLVVSTAWGHRAVSVLVTLGFTVIASLTPMSGTDPFVGTALGLALLGGLYSCARVFLRRFILGEHGITYHTPLRPPRFIPWTEVARLDLAEFGYHAVLHLEDGTRQYLGHRLRGTDQLVVALRRHIPTARIREANAIF